MMLSQSETSHWIDVNVRIEAFEVARRDDPRVPIADFLPAEPEELRLTVLTELIRVDMEYAWQSDDEFRSSVEDYVRQFPELKDHPNHLEQIVWEEDRQRQFARRAATSSSASATGEALGRGRSPLSLVAPVALAEGEVSEPLASRPGELPHLGAEFLGFRLLAILGEGAFSRVYMARQGDLANRLVALKVAKDVFDEPQTLASLQHTNIVPIYSVHRLGSLEAICMPYLGSTTLADLVESLEKSPMLPRGADALLGTMYGTFRSHPQDQPTVARSIRLNPSTHAPSVTRAEPDPDAAVTITQGSSSKQKPTTAIDELRQRTYVEAVIWLAAKLAGGLSHAHERGVLHQDLKPANVLFTDEGEPMLLDFNLATNPRACPSEGQRVGGTLPYMAPEHLKAFQSRQPIIDARTDIYSLGVILYQLLSGRLPFPTRSFKQAEDIDQMIADRREPPPALRSLNRMVSPAVAAIVAKCLAPNPEDRYASARDLHEDLHRQYSHRPLRHVREPSMAERFRKWRSRHPRLSSGSSVALMALLLVGVLAGFSVERNRRVFAMETKHRYEESLAAFDRDADEIRYIVHAPSPTSDQLQMSIELSRSNLSRLLDTDRHFAPRPTFEEFLSPAVRQRLGEQLYLLVRASIQRWKLQRAESQDASPPLDDWLQWNARAIELSSSGAVPQALRWQKAQLLEWAGQPQSAQKLLAEIQKEGTGSPEDLFLTASELMGHGKLSQAISLLQRLLSIEPNHYWGRLALGHCLAAYGHDREAVACYDIAIAIRPRSAWPYHLRGISHLRLQQYEAAENDLTEAIARDGDWSEARILRAVAAQRLRHWSDAEKDLQTALREGAPPVRIHCMLARLYEEAGRKDRASDELRIGLSLPANDEMSWVTRGLAVLSTDPEEALRNFERAIALNPKCRPALQNKAYVLSEILGRNEEGEQVLRQMQDIFPDYIPAEAGRAILLARLGKRDEAVHLADDCLLKSPEPGIIYQLAGVFAATGRKHPADADRAVDLLAVAMRYGVADELIAQDPGLDPIRNHPGFRELVAAQKTLSEHQIQPAPVKPLAKASVLQTEEQP